MRKLNGTVASIATAAALALSGHAYAQSAPIAHAQPANPAIPDVTVKQQQDEVMNLFTAHLGLWLTRDPTS